MALLSEEAKRDIVHKFDLPERRSKIASLLKHNEQLYCICRTTDSDRLMIACDACDEWYHVDCMNLTKAESDAIKCYYCPVCVSSNPGLKTIYKGARGSMVSKAEPKAERSKGTATVTKGKRGVASRPAKKVLTEKKQTKCSCDGCQRTRNCGKCAGCNKHNTRVKCVERKCSRKKMKLSDEDFNSSRLSDSEEDEKYNKKNSARATSSSKKRPAASKAKDVKKKPVRKPAGKGAKRQYNRRKPLLEESPIRYTSSEDETIDYGKGPRQCYGPSCVAFARPNSKYCSDFCGVALAHARIYAILPVRLTEWNISTTVADEHNKTDLEDVWQKYAEATNEIKTLLRHRDDLDYHLEHVREIELNSDSSEEEHEDEGMIYCVSCGHEIAMKTCLKHMEKCFNKNSPLPGWSGDQNDRKTGTTCVLAPSPKGFQYCCRFGHPKEKNSNINTGWKRYEGKTTFGSAYKQTTIDGPPLFCDAYNAASNTYCKRLAVLCAEHVKLPKIGEKELCGYPVNELTNLEDPFGKFCRVRKKKCNTHFAWEKLRRASIDMQRVRMYFRMDELLDKELKLRTAQKNRGGLMSLLLNSTFNHEFMGEKLKKQHEKDEEEEESSSSSSE